MTDDNSELDLHEDEEVLDLTYNEEPIKIKHQDGTVHQYMLREVDGEGREMYLNSLAVRMKTGADGKPTGIRDFKGMSSALITRCLFDEDDKAVPAKTIQNWPASVVKKLYEKAQRISALDDKAEDDAKND